MLNKIRKLLGIKTYIERYAESREASNIVEQEWNDQKFLNAIKEAAFRRFMDWNYEQNIIESLDKTKPYWELQIPCRIAWSVGVCYHVSHSPTAKYLNTDLEKLINEEFELLKP